MKTRFEVDFFDFQVDPKNFKKNISAKLDGTMAFYSSHVPIRRRYTCGSPKRVKIGFQTAPCKTMHLGYYEI